MGLKSTSECWAEGMKREVKDNLFDGTCVINMNDNGGIVTMYVIINLCCHIATANLSAGAGMYIVRYTIWHTRKTCEHECD